MRIVRPPGGKKGEGNPLPGTKSPWQLSCALRAKGLSAAINTPRGGRCRRCGRG